MIGQFRRHLFSPCWDYAQNRSSFIDVDEVFADSDRKWGARLPENFSVMNNRKKAFIASFAGISSVTIVLHLSRGYLFPVQSVADDDGMRPAHSSRHVSALKYRCCK